MFADRQSIALVTDASGACTAYSTVLTGRIHALVYVKTDFANGVDFTVTLESTGEALYTGTDVNAATTVYPRVAVHDATGAAALYAAGGTALRDYAVAANDRVKVVVAQGGNTKSGSIIVVTV